MTINDYLLNFEEYRWIQTDINNLDVLDFIMDSDKNFWVVNKISGKKFYGYMVYKKDKNGDRYNFYTQETYTKSKDFSNYSLIELPKFNFSVFKPKLFYLAHKEYLPGIWKKFADSLNAIGISDNNIGIFGSYLIGFDIIKDVDFVVYGLNNLETCYKNIKIFQQKIGATSISSKHIDYQYNKHNASYNSNYDLKTIISRNWSGVQIKDGVLSTIRFVDESNQQIPKIDAQKRILTGYVVDWLKSALVPRKATVCIDNENYTIYTHYWKLQSFARDKDKIIVYGKVDFDNKIIVVEDNDDYIKFI